MKRIKLIAGFWAGALLIAIIWLMITPLSGSNEKERKLVREDLKYLHAEYLLRRASTKNDIAIEDLAGNEGNLNEPIENYTFSRYGLGILYIGELGGAQGLSISSQGIVSRTNEYLSPRETKKRGE